MTERYVHTLWCDDIRLEVGNKPSFMGVYTGRMQLAALPALLPKLGVYTWICSPIERDYSTVKIRIVRDDGLVIVEMAPELSEVRNAEQPQPPEDATMRVFAFGVAFGPIEIPVGCRYLKVAAELDGEAVDGPKLRFEVNPAAVAQANPAAHVAVGSLAPEQG